MTVPCTAGVDGIYILPPPIGSTELPRLRIASHVKFDVDFGAETSVQTGFHTINVQIPTTIRRSDHAVDRCDLRTVEIAEPLYPNVIYDVTVDYGPSLPAAHGQTTYDHEVMAVDVVPAAPRKGEQVVIAVSGTTGNSSTAYPLIVHVSGTTIDVSLDLFYGAVPILGHFAQADVLPPLPLGTYTVNVDLRTIAYGSAPFPYAHSRAQTKFTVGAGPRRRPG